MARPIVLGGPDAGSVEQVFREAGCEVEVLCAPAADRLRALDAEGVRYYLVHVGADDGEPEGSFERAHDRIEVAEAATVAERVRPLERPQVHCVAFGYKLGIPDDASWLIDVRLLDNPYWRPELRTQTGLDEGVRHFVLEQPGAQELLERLESDLRWAVPQFGRDRLTVAIGCTGGKHRSVAVAGELARRLADLEGYDVFFEAPALEHAELLSRPAPPPSRPLTYPEGS